MDSYCLYTMEVISMEHLFVNGQEIEMPVVNGVSGTIADSNESLFFGSRQGGQIQLHGYMSQIGIYDSSSEGEIHDMMFDISSVSGMIGGWELSKIENNAVIDISEAITWTSQWCYPVISNQVKMLMVTVLT